MRPVIPGASSIPLRSVEKAWGLSPTPTDFPKVTDPAFAGKVVDATDAQTKARAKLIYRDIPLVSIQNTWSIEQARGAIYAHLAGIFYASGLLTDSILGDDRVSATLNSRASAIFGREPRFKAANDSQAARECLDAWTQWWPRFSGTPAIREMQDYGVMNGFAHAQINWDTTQPGLDFAPYLFPWHSVFEWYDWESRCYRAISQDGDIPIIPGNGKWVEWSNFSSYRGWVRGALRSVVEPWMLRHFGFRDMARFGEVHGNPTRVGYVPMVGDPTERADFEQSLANLGGNTAMIVPRGVDENDGLGYDYKLIEAEGESWQVHPAQIDRCDMAIVLALYMTNTQVVEGGSYGAVKANLQQRSEATQLDNQSWKRVLYNHVARPFAFLNFGNADLAPFTWWDVRSTEEYESNAKQGVQFGTMVEVLRRGGVQFTDEEALRTWAAERFGLHGMPNLVFKDPVSSGGFGK
jgi:hypothetical protein